MTETIAQRAIRWDNEGHTCTGAPSYDSLHQRLMFAARNHYHEYVPTSGPDHQDYEDRLESWLTNLTSESDQRSLLQLASSITFFTREDFIKLHQIAFQGPIARWIVDLTTLMLDDPTLDDALADELHNHTWFCALSDSMQIADFHHANNLGGIDFRPDLRTLAQFGDFKKLMQFLHNRNAPSLPRPIRRIVILEDFIGGGVQLRDAEPLILNLASEGIPMLLAPLLICPKGHDTVQRLAAQCKGMLTYRPIVLLDPSSFLLPSPSVDEPSLWPTLRDLLARTYSQVEGNRASHPRPYSAYGCWDTGALVVMYSNTPANTLALIHHTSNTWRALFPRSARVR